MRLSTIFLMTVLVLAAALGCGGKSSRMAGIDRPEVTVGDFAMSGSGPVGAASDEAIVQRHKARERVELAGRDAEGLGVMRRDGSPGLALIDGMVILTGLESDADVMELLALARSARARWALGLPVDTVVTVHPEFGDVRCVSGEAPALLFDLERARWRSRQTEVRQVRVSRLHRGTVYSLPSGHVVFAEIRGSVEADEESDGLAATPWFDEQFEELRRRPAEMVVERPATDGDGVWVLSLDGRSLLLPAPGGMSFSNALIERRRR